jgi:putative transposase
MPRPPRKDFEDSLHHIMNRGAARQPIFFQDSDRTLFLDCLSLACLAAQMDVHSYCLMDNHFHLLVRSRNANLSTFLKQLSGRYTRLLNKRIGRDGPLFRGRANSILIQDDSQLLQTLRYIHLNPVAAGLCGAPEGWHWSSARCYSGLEAPPPWLDANSILGMFANTAPGSGYQTFLHEGVDLETKKLYGHLRWDVGV